MWGDSANPAGAPLQSGNTAPDAPPPADASPDASPFVQTDISKPVPTSTFISVPPSVIIPIPPPATTTDQCTAQSTTPDAGPPDASPDIGPSTTCGDGIMAPTEEYDDGLGTTTTAVARAPRPARSLT